MQESIFSNLRERMEEALKHSKADYTEIRIETGMNSGLLFRGEESDQIGFFLS